MQHGFVSVATGVPQVKVADCALNAKNIIELIKEAEEKRVKLLVLPELCLTGYTCSDLFLSDLLVSRAIESLGQIMKETAGTGVLTLLGLPFSYRGRLYNCMAVFQSGKLLGMVSKTKIPNYSVYYELRHFTPGPGKVIPVRILGEEVPFGANILFECAEMPSFRVAAEICEDLWAPDSPSIVHAMAGANIICNGSASDETVGKASHRRSLVSVQSAKLVCAYLYANCGNDESSQDMVYSGQSIVAENGTILAENERYTTGLTVTQVDTSFLENERRRKNTFSGCADESHQTVYFHTAVEQTLLTRAVNPMPFVPSDNARRNERCREILDIQSVGLARRLAHIGCKNVVLGVSGGLDSTLALIVTHRTFRRLGLDPSGIHAITMPCYGTTGRTRGNAERMSRCLHTDFLEIPIGKAVAQHFKDIGQKEEVHDITYENSQARERTQVLMDYANKIGGIVIGTGDLSELALGWATYNGDHMSMYGVNVSVPKTLVRYLVAYEAENTTNQEYREILEDVLDTPVSPELLPPENGQVAQVTEDIVGPYQLHDFFLFHTVRRGASPEKILRLAKIAFAGSYTDETVEKWLTVFMRRFFSQQFKRSCLPDGPKIGSVSLSPRGDWRMPSDGSGEEWKRSIGNRKF